MSLKQLIYLIVCYTHRKYMCYESKKAFFFEFEKAIRSLPEVNKMPVFPHQNICKILYYQPIVN